MPRPAGTIGVAVAAGDTRLGAVRLLPRLPGRAKIWDMSAPRMLVAYHTSEGQTAKIASRVAASLGELGADVELATANDAAPPSGYDAVVLGDSIHLGRHSGELRRYVADHVADLNEMPVGLFQVSLTSATDDEQHRHEAHDMMEALLEATGLRPEVVGLFAGALRYGEYGWLKRRMMRALATREGLGVDGDQEYTDWDDVERFARDVFALLAETT